MTPLVVAVSALVTGLALSGVVPAASPVAGAWMLTGSVGALIVVARLAWAGPVIDLRASLALAAFVAGGTVGWRAEQQAWAPRGISIVDIERDVAAGALVRVAGTLRHDASVTGTGVRLDLRVSRVWWRGAWRATDLGARVTVRGAQSAGATHRWTRGRWIEAPVGAWRRPLPYLNFGMPDAERALARQGVRVFASVKSAALVQEWPAPWWEEAAARARSAIRHAVVRHVPSPDAQAVVAAILIGDRSTMDAEIARRLQHAGVYHVVAISGGNVAVWLSVLLLLPRSLGLTTRVATLWLAAGVIVFAGIVDGGASVVRAVSVAAAGVAARWWDLRLAALQALAVAAGVQAVMDPLRVYDAGCLLSFGAAGMLVCLLGAWRQTPLVWIPRATSVRMMAAAGRVMLASAAIEAALLPITARWFATVTGAGVLANLVALPAMAVVQLAGLLLLPAAAVSSVAGDALGVLAALGVRALLQSADILYVLPWLVREVPPPAVTSIAAYYASLTLLLAGWHTRRRVVFLPALVLLASCLAWIVWGGPDRSGSTPWTWPDARGWQTASWPREPWLLVTVLDVGQGDATVIRFPSGRTWLVDAGGSTSEAFDVGERVTSLALWALGHRDLSRVVITHAHPDHAAGTPAVLRRLRAREWLAGVPVPGDPMLEAVSLAASRSGVRHRPVRAGDGFVDGPVRVSVLHPPPPDWERIRVRNDDSVVLWLRFGSFSLVLPGDVSQESEGEWGGRLLPAPLGVLKLAHHGSVSSTGVGLLDRYRPVLALASSGRGNRFGHPARPVLQRLSEAGAGLLRTDRHGALQLATNGRTLLVRTASGEHMAFSARQSRLVWPAATPLPSDPASRPEASALPHAIGSRPPGTVW